MIPSDVANSLRQILLDPHAAANERTQPVLPSQQIANILSNLVPGQRVLAEIQALMPNGSYRAIIAQRDITLALPFSAKAGDSVELEVVETDGNLSLSFVANRSTGTASGPAQESVPTILSQTGKLIGDLLGSIDNQGKRAPPAPLNGSQALVQTMPKTATDLAPLLKQVLSQSGMFYEAHQARWVAGQLPTAALLQEPQGKLSPAPLNAPPFINRASSFLPGNPVNGQLSNMPQDPLLQPAPAIAPTSPSSPAKSVLPDIGALTLSPLSETGGQSGASNVTAAVDQKLGEKIGETPQDRSSATRPLPQMAVTTNAPPVPNENPVSRELVPLVQQQLNGLATQNFVWQGQVWPGQPMWWEISGDPETRPSPDSEAASQWLTRLKLNLPTLGGVDIMLRLGAGGDLAISVRTENTASETKLRDSAQPLREQLEAAGLRLTQLHVDHGQAGE